MPPLERQDARALLSASARSAVVAGHLSRRGLLFKAIIFLLLVVNTSYFAVAGSTSEALDAVAWLVLLTLFEAETGFLRGRTTGRWRLALRTMRVIAGAGVFAATMGYLFEDNTLDAVNGVLWIAVVVLLELEVRYAAHLGFPRIAFSAIAGVLYLGLLMLVLVWASRGQWLDAYDALLWLAAFAAIELGLFNRARARAALA